MIRFEVNNDYEAKRVFFAESADFLIDLIADSIYTQADEDLTYFMVVTDSNRHYEIYKNTSNHNYVFFVTLVERVLFIDWKI